MESILKQVVGIDVSQDELVVKLGRMRKDCITEVYASKNFVNNLSGFTSLVSWVNKLKNNNVSIRYVMEATGVYHESLAYYLDENAIEVSIVLPVKISNYMRSLDKKTITDSTSAEAITFFGLERDLAKWQRPTKVYKSLRQLTRERSQIIEMRTICKNQLHAEKSEAEPSESGVVRLNTHISLLELQEREVMSEIKALIKSDQEVREAAELLCSIPGVGILTAATVLGETNGFDLIRNKKQLVSYVGLDIIEKQSGTSIKGKPRISKKGNKYLRKSLHLPALSAIRHDERFKGVFVRLVSRDGVKMKAAVAVQRKLLEMMFTIYKKKERYDPNYFISKSESVVCEKN